MRESSLRVRKAIAARVAVRYRGLSAHFVVHAGLLHAPDAHLTPARDGHVLDEGFLEGRLRLEFFEQGGEEP